MQKRCVKKMLNRPIVVERYECNPITSENVANQVVIQIGEPIISVLPQI